MIDSEKRDFMATITTTADLYDKTIKPERVAVYWEALKHRSLADIRLALNKHVQDAERGRWFPLPADITAQLPAEVNQWPNADEAWALCPKDESDSAAMFPEMAKALYVAGPLIDEGDRVAARMAFKGAYDREVARAKAEGGSPKWYTSLGHDVEGRHAAEVKTIEMKNLGRDRDSQLAIPAPPSDDAGILRLTDDTATGDKKLALDALAKLKGELASE